MIPSDIPGVVAALTEAYDGLDESRAAALAAALENTSDVMRIVDGFEALRTAETLPEKALIALAAASGLLIRHGFNGLAQAAQDEMNRRAAAIAALPQPEMPAITLPVPAGEQISDLDG